jgi:molecular chaperone GrpE
MVKKKTPDQEEASHKKHTETSDNKKNNNILDGNETEKVDMQPADDQGAELTGTATAETQPSAKVVTDEKSPEEKLAEMQDKYIRLSAEFDNYRKRTLREKIELSKYASEDLLLKILPVMDDFERALSHIVPP